MKLIKNFVLALLLWVVFFALSVALLHLAN
jgi:hypothetical protein